MNRINIMNNKINLNFFAALSDSADNFLFSPATSAKTSQTKPVGQTHPQNSRPVSKAKNPINPMNRNGISPWLIEMKVYSSNPAPPEIGPLAVCKNGRTRVISPIISPRINDCNITQFTRKKNNS